jgi:hypothetical protein
MKIIELSKDKMYALIGQVHDPPSINSVEDEARFQAEIRQAYAHLLACLSVFGTEGDYYGVSDYTVRPDLRDRPTVKAPPAAHTREFVITILKRKFYKSKFLPTVRRFLLSSAPKYRITVTQDFDPRWDVTMFLTVELIQLYCDDPSELNRWKKALSSV